MTSSSQSQLEEHLKNASEPLGDDRLIQSYQAVLRLLRSLGYRAPSTINYALVRMGIALFLKVAAGTLIVPSVVRLGTHA